MHGAYGWQVAIYTCHVLLRHEVDSWSIYTCHIWLRREVDSWSWNYNSSKLNHDLSFGSVPVSKAKVSINCCIIASTGFDVHAQNNIWIL